jgi:hypothetical protein
MSKSHLDLRNEAQRLGLSGLALSVARKAELDQWILSREADRRNVELAILSRYNADRDKEPKAPPTIEELRHAVAMSARFKGRCRICQERILQGSRIRFLGKQQGAVHEGCAATVLVDDEQRHEGQGQAGDEQGEGQGQEQGEGQGQAGDVYESRDEQDRRGLDEAFDKAQQAVSDNVAPSLQKDVRDALDEAQRQARQREQAIAGAADAALRDAERKVEEAKKTGGVLVVQDGEGQERTRIESPHPLLSEVVHTLESVGAVYLWGPKGSGKTTLAAQVAKALELQFSFDSLSAGTSEGHLLGRMLFDGGYVSAAFREAYENGGLHLLDEVDNADPNVAVILNAALANGELRIPNDRETPTVKRHDRFRLLAAGNVRPGHGADDEYSRRRLRGSLQLRFRARGL